MIEEGVEREDAEAGSAVTPLAASDEDAAIEDALPAEARPAGGRLFRAVLISVSVGMVAAGAFLVLKPDGKGRVLTPEAIRPSGASTDVSAGTPGPESSPGSVKARGGGGPGPTGGTPDPDADQAHGGLKFEVKLIPECVLQGAPMRAEISTTPGAAITLAVVYKDGQTYGQWGTFRADPDGRFIYPWTVPAVAPKGLARFLAGGDDQTLQESAAGYWNFTVAGVGEC